MLRFFVLKDKKPVPASSMTQWAEQLADYHQRVVKQTHLPNEIFISTVFLGLDIMGGDKPVEELVLFESMVFGGEYNHYKRMYCSYQEAEQGHQEIIEMHFEV